MYGLKPAELDTKEDVNLDCLYFWEANNTTLLEGATQKDIIAERSLRKLFNEKVRALDKWISSLRKAKQDKDLTKVAEAKEKY